MCANGLPSNTDEVVAPYKDSATIQSKGGRKFDSRLRILSTVSATARLLRMMVSMVR